MNTGSAVAADRLAARLRLHRRRHRQLGTCLIGSVVLLLLGSALAFTMHRIAGSRQAGDGRRSRRAEADQ